MLHFCTLGCRMAAALGLLALAMSMGVPAKAANSQTGAMKKMEITVNHGICSTDKDLELLKKFKEMGATSVQTYVAWKDIEKVPGQYDWSVFDRNAELISQAGLKWVPFVITGPHYITPDYVRQDKSVVFAHCLKHGKDSTIPSIWSPGFRKIIEGYLQAFADHYGKTGVLESVNVGITGDYGEAIFQVIGNWPGDYHAHADMWCGDELAVADFRQSMKKLYVDSIEKLNADWGAHYADWNALQPFRQEDAPSVKAWLSELQWYRDSMTAYADWYLADDAFSNFAVTRMVSSACRFYGAFYGNEPAATVTPVGSLGRLFNAHAGGGRQLFLYSGNVFDGDKPNHGWDLLHGHQPYMTQFSPRVDMAVFYPTSAMATGKYEPEIFVRMREFIDYDFVDERMVMDGAMDKYPMMVVFATDLARREVIERISKWVENGGILISINSQVADWNRDARPWNRLIGLPDDYEETVGICRPKLLDEAILPSFKDCGHWIFTNSMREPVEGCQVLVRQNHDKAGANIWLRDVGKGLVMADFGPGDLKKNEESWMDQPAIPLLFLNDAFAYLSGQGRLAHVPGSLWLSSQKVFLSESTDGHVEAFNPNEEEVRFERDGKSITLPAESITTLP